MPGTELLFITPSIDNVGTLVYLAFPPTRYEENKKEFT
jgi:hypothetical protein